MNVFITGGSGLLGSMLLRTVPKKITPFANYHVNKLIPQAKGCTFFQLDVRRKKQLDNIFRKVRPNVVIHTAAKASPDFCEFNQKEAWDINVNGTRNVLLAARDVGARAIFISSNQVFSGKKPPYGENSPVDPVNFYGKTKVESEKDVLKNDGDTMVIRLMTMYGWGNPKGQKNTATWVIDMLSKKQPIKVVNDIFNNFLWVGQAAETLWDIALNNIDIRLLNVAGGEVANRYEFACKVAKIFFLNKSLISPVKKSFFKEEAPRPMNTIYNIDLFKKTLKIKALSLDEGLREMKKWEKKIEWEKIK